MAAQVVRLGDKNVKHFFKTLAELQIWRQPNLLVLSDEFNNMNKTHSAERQTLLLPPSTGCIFP